MFNQLQTFPNLCENLYLILLMSFLNLKILKRKPIKSIGIMPHLKPSKNMLLGQRNWKKINPTHMHLWKYGQSLTIQKSLIIKRLRFSKKRFLIWVYHLVLHYILGSNKKIRVWINIIFFILWCFNQMTSPYFLI